jgi:DNA transformation protein
MSPLSSFAQHSVDLLSGVGPVTGRSMFGGYCLFMDGLAVGLIDDDRLYLRVDDQTRGQFEAAGSAPFVYPSKKGPMTMNSYWSIPEEAVDDPEQAVKWGRLALEAARRANAAKANKPKARAKAAARKPAARRKRR